LYHRENGCPLEVRGYRYNYGQVIAIVTKQQVKDWRGEKCLGLLQKAYTKGFPPKESGYELSNWSPFGIFSQRKNPLGRQTARDFLPEGRLYPIEASLFDKLWDYVLGQDEPPFKNSWQEIFSDKK